MTGVQTCALPICSGTVQKTIELPDGSALILSVAKYQSPSGKKIQDEAVTPNVIVAPSVDQELAEAEGPETQNVQKPETHTDEQLNKALDLLKQKNA